MGGVIKKKKKSLFSKIIGKIRSTPPSNEQRDIDSNIPLDDVRTDSDDLAAITSRRKELKTKKHRNKDAVVYFDGNE